MPSQRPRQSLAIAAAPAAVAVWGGMLVAGGVFALAGGRSVAAIVAGAACVVIATVGLLARAPMFCPYAALIVTSLAALGGGAVDGDDGPVLAGLVGLVISGAASALGVQLHGLRASLAARGDVRPVAAPPPPATTTEELLRQIYEHVLLSDTAKRVLFRDRELQLLRSAVEQQIARGAYDAASALCDDMADLFGCREEAEQFRARILQVRREQDETRIMAALRQLDEHLALRNWAQAHQEAARIKRLYPESHLLQDVDQRIIRAREEHKADLERRFIAAAKGDEIAGAMTLLKELDRFLTPAEAERLSTVAEQVVTRRREKLGEEFKRAVSERHWAEAVRVGESIIDEFPRSRMGDEVRAVMDTIRGRASGEPLPTEGVH